MRARAVERREEDLEEAKAHLRRMRERGKEYFDRRHNIRDEPLEPGMLVLVHDTVGAMDMSSSRKLSFRWMGPYRILGSNPALGNYTLTKLNGAELRGTFTGNRLKRFYPRAAELLAPLEVEMGSDGEDEDLYGPGETIGREGEHAGDVGPPLPNDGIVVEIPAPRK